MSCAKKLPKFSLISSPALVYCCSIKALSNQCVTLALDVPSKYARTCHFSERSDVYMKYFVLVSPH